jgi:xanthine dehydrogenase accessory factor
VRTAVLRALLDDLRAKRPAVLATWLGSGEARLLHPGDADGGGGDAALLERAREALASDRSALAESAEGAVFLRVFAPPVRLVVVGAVHVTQALAPMARLAGYRVAVIDPRRSFASEERLAGVELIREWPGEALARMGIDRRTAVVALTHDPKLDDPALVAALRSPAFYVGALGSRKTQAARRERLRAEGIGEADLDRLDGPVGLPIGAVSPGEIAVSILAQLVSRLRQPRESPGAAGR